MDKKSLRRQMKLKRAAFFLTEERKLEDERIIRNVISIWKNYDTVFLYDSFGAEVPTVELMAQAFREGKTVALPRIGKDRKMEFYEISPETKLVSHAFGMKEPPEECPLIEAGPSTLILVPGLAFDLKHDRLGYGGGYYDIYLSDHPDACSAGICYRCQMVEHLEADVHDRKVDRVITADDQE